MTNGAASGKGGEGCARGKGGVAAGVVAAVAIAMLGFGAAAGVGGMHLYLRFRHKFEKTSRPYRGYDEDWKLPGHEMDDL